MVGAGAGTGTGISDNPFYPFTLQLSQFRDQVTGTVREPRVSFELTYPVSGIIRQNGQLVLEATTQKNGDSLRVFNWASTTNNGATTMSGAFTKIEPYRSMFNDPYTIRTEHEFLGLSHTPSQ